MKPDLIGKKFGRWTVVSYDQQVGNKRFWNCECECGNSGAVREDSLIGGGSLCCGCIHNEWLSRKQYKHGLSNTPIQAAWTAMKDRCYNPKCKAYKDYGARGIQVCDRWMNSFLDFCADMGPRPDGFSLGRIDNDGDYTPENCRWETVVQQCNNKRDNRRYTLDGETHTVTEWARKINARPLTILQRLYDGWPPEKALTEPIHRQRASKQHQALNPS